MKKKSKPTKAQRELMADWSALELRWASMPKFALTGATTGRTPSMPEFQPLPAGEAYTAGPARLSSRVTPGGSTAPAPTKTYTGTALVGVAVMHKSNLVPVFSVSEAKDAASMRRN